MPVLLCLGTAILNPLFVFASAPKHMRAPTHNALDTIPRTDTFVRRYSISSPFREEIFYFTFSWNPAQSQDFESRKRV